MKYIHNWKNAIIGRVALLALLLMGGVSAQADTKIYIDDFSVAPGEKATVAVNMVTDRTDLYYVSLELSLPDGLDVVRKTNDENRINLTLNRDRVRGFQLAGNPVTGKIILNSLPSGGSLPTIQGTSGALFTFQVEADDQFEGGKLKLEDVVVKNIDQEKVDVSVIPTTNVSAEAELEDGDIALSFSQASALVGPGATYTVGVEMENPDVVVEGFQADLTVPAGWTYRIVNSQRMTNDGANNRVLAMNGVEGESGVIFSIELTAPITFTGSATVTLSNISAKVEGSNSSTTLSDITLTVIADNSVSPVIGSFALGFPLTSPVVAPGETINIPVNLNNESILVRGFQANFSVPEGWTYSIEESDRMECTVSGDRILAYNDVEGESGTIFTISLTAPEDFTTGTATVKVFDAVATVGSQSVELNDISLGIKAKNPADLAAALADVQDLRDQLAAKKALIESEYPAAVNDPELVAEEEAIEAAIDALEQKINDDYAAGKLDLDEVAAEKAPIAERIEALEAAAKEIQDEDGNKDNEAGKAALDDEIAELQKKLDDAVASQPKDLPKAATKEISDAADAIQKDIDALKAQVEKDYEDGKLTADSKLDPAKKQAILDAIDALKALIDSWLRGDVDKDGDVDMDDFYALKKLISEEKTPKADEDANAFYRCDANADGEINVGDLQGILNICIGLNANGK